MVKLERKITATTLVSLTSLNKFEDAKRVIWSCKYWRRTGNAMPMVKKGQTMIYNILHRELKIEQHKKP